MKKLNKFSHMQRHDNTILNILLILFYNVFKTLKRKNMLNLTISDKTSEMLFHLNKSIIVHLHTCIVDQWTNNKGSWHWDFTLSGIVHFQESVY